jgi:hypothetical protein
MQSTYSNQSNEAWGLHPILEVPNDYPPAVMFTLLDHDPIPAFSKLLKEHATNDGRDRSRRPITPAQALIQEAFVFAAWDKLFLDVPDKQLAWVYRNEGKLAPSEITGAEPTLVVLLKSTQPAGKKWLVTRPSWIEGKAVSWCIPVEVALGKTVDVRLNPQNTLALNMN